MPAPRTISLTLDGTDRLGVTPLWCWQANPLTLTCALGALTLLTGAATIEAKIHATQVPAGTTPLAADSVAAADEVTFDFTTAEMSFDIGTGVKALICYLFITALDAGGAELQTLYAGRIEIKATSYSDILPAVAPASAVVRLVSLIPDDDGLHTFTALGATWKAALTDFVAV